MVKIYKDRPLPEHTKLDYQECYAKILLEAYFQKFKKDNLIIRDKPDLCNRGNNIGIEVTDIMSKDKKEALKLWYTMPYIDQEKRPRKIERMEQLGVKYSAGMQIWPAIHYDKGFQSKPFQELYEAIRNKTKKINSGNYTIFQQNELLLFSELMIDGFEYFELMDILKDIINEGKIKFDVIYIVTAGKIYCFDFKNNKCEEIFVFNQEEIGWAARRMVEEAEEND